jgi:hypothetical protein
VAPRAWRVIALKSPNPAVAHEPVICRDPERGLAFDRGREKVSGFDLRIVIRNGSAVIAGA